MHLRKMIWILLMLSLLCACSAPTLNGEPSNVSTTSQPTEPTSQTTEPTTAPTTQAAAEPLETLRAALSEVTHFEYNDLYMELLSYGFEQHTLQTTAQDGSFHFTNEVRYWDHSSDWEQTQTVEYYYRYENDVMHYYARQDGGELQHGTLTQSQLAEVNASEELIIGAVTVFPAYLENFTEDQDEQGQLCFRYRLPTKNVLEEQNIFASFINGAAYYAQVDVSALADTYIHCTVWVDEQTLRPTRLYQDYEELKPYLLSDGALSGEYALDTDLLHLEILFGYDAPETTDIPAEFLAE